jgi:hypothetical protein
VFAHEMDKSRKLLLNTGQTRYSGLANQRVQFCWVRRQSGAPSASARASFSRSNGIWLGEGQDPRLLNELWRWLVDLNKGKWKGKKAMTKNNCINFDCCVTSISRDQRLYRQQDVASTPQNSKFGMSLKFTKF